MIGVKPITIQRWLDRWIREGESAQYTKPPPFDN
jgi:hypothetical protein